jgi:hypothetical protein
LQDESDELERISRDAGIEGLEVNSSKAVVGYGFKASITISAPLDEQALIR